MRIQIPGANLILSNTQVEKLTGYISSGDIFKVGTSAKLADLINLLDEYSAYADV